MSDNSRIEDLRRRLQKDPESIAFAQLAEEYRRAGRLAEAIEVCRDGLARHPGYLSARVTLGRALWDVGQLDDAQREFEVVRAAAPDNLAAVRSLAEIHQMRGDLARALDLFKAALAQARNDPELQRTVADLTRRMAPSSIPGTITSAPPSDVPSLEFELPGRRIVALEQWLQAIHVARTQPRA